MMAGSVELGQGPAVVGPRARFSLVLLYGHPSRSAVLGAAIMMVDLLFIFASHGPGRAGGSTAGSGPATSPGLSGSDALRHWQAGPRCQCRFKLSLARRLGLPSPAGTRARTEVTSRH